MNGITYYKLVSPYEGDITKNCALTGAEVDNNFFTLEGRDIKSVELKDDKIVVNLMNGTSMTTDNVTEGCVKGLSFTFDEVNGILTITQNGITQNITGFATNYNVGDAISVNGSLVGNGLAKSPVGISPVHKTGQYRPVIGIVKMTDGEKLPSCPYVYPGDRYLTEETINDFGYLYNYEGLKQIACRLRESNSEWRIPTKEDWDDMLDAVEPNEDSRNHTDARSNKFLGEFAGKLLKSTKYWKKEQNTCGCAENDTCIDYSESDCCACSCGKNITCSPTYCGEYSTCCHRRHHRDNKGLDKYGFSVIPAGYANEAKDYLYFKERAYFWTATNHEYRDAYIKAFCYDKSSVLQDIFASDNYLSVRLVKTFNGDNFNEREDILGSTYSTVLMPSSKHGSAIWTSVNISIGDCGCNCNCGAKYILPNDGQGMEYSKKYFVNEWNGKKWLRKEVADGESVVVKTDGMNKIYEEYRVVDGELKNVATMIYDKVIENIGDDIADITGRVDELNEKIDGEIERSTVKDAELESAINLIDERVTAAEGTIEEHTAAIAGINEHLVQTDAAIAAVDEKLDNAVEELNAAIEEEKTARETKDEELETAINTEREERTADVQALQEEDVRINARIDEVEAEIEEMAADIDEKIAQEKAEREAKDAEIEAQLLDQEGTEFNKETGVLTLKSKGGTNDVEVQFNFNFGSF